jgi:hypothetical protein
MWYLVIFKRAITGGKAQVVEHFPSMQGIQSLVPKKKKAIIGDYEFKR